MVCLDFLDEVPYVLDARRVFFLHRRGGRLQRLARLIAPEALRLAVVVEPDFGTTDPVLQFVGRNALGVETMERRDLFLDLRTKASARLRSFFHQRADALPHHGIADALRIRARAGRPRLVSICDSDQRQALPIFSFAMPLPAKGENARRASLTSAGVISDAGQVGNRARQTAPAGEGEVEKRGEAAQVVHLEARQRDQLGENRPRARRSG